MSNNKKFYEILEIPTNATPEEIKKGYKKMALLWHPDRRKGDPQATEKFKEIGMAYETLSDPKKKELYDKYGEEGLKEGGQTQYHDPNSIFNIFFPRGSQRESEKGEDIVHKLPCTLEELYVGRTRKLAITHQVVCPNCSGKGSPNPNAVRVCEACKGQGQRTVIRRIGPGFMTQSQMPCSECNQTGRIINKGEVCTNCNAENVISSKKIVEVHVEAGMTSGQQLRFENAGDEKPGVPAGDLVIIIEEIPHALFTRKGRDLHISKPLTLSEALCGYSFKVPTLDGRLILVRAPEGEVVRPGEQRFVVNEGMTVYRQPLEKGDLVISFTVTFPPKHSLSVTQKDRLMAAFPLPPQGRILGPPKPGLSEEDVEEVETQEMSEKQTPTRDNDDPGPRTGPRRTTVQTCTVQ